MKAAPTPQLPRRARILLAPVVHELDAHRAQSVERLEHSVVRDRPGVVDHRVKGVDGLHPRQHRLCEDAAVRLREEGPDDVAQERICHTEVREAEVPRMSEKAQRNLGSPRRAATRRHVSEMRSSRALARVRVRQPSPVRVSPVLRRDKDAGACAICHVGEIDPCQPRSP